jgi:uncharacterized membrane protein YgaE (UPF0421/DUF939 family)
MMPFVLLCPHGVTSPDFIFSYFPYLLVSVGIATGFTVSLVRLLSKALHLKR